MATSEPKFDFHLAENRGLAILVTCDYEGTPGIPTLESANVDKMEMMSTFRQFQYEIILLTNEAATKPSIKALVEQLSDYMKGYSESTCNADGGVKTIVFYFSGHGMDGSQIIANDGNEVFLKHIVKPLVKPEFTGVTCNEIPKLFMIDAARGNNLPGSEKFRCRSTQLTGIWGNFRIDYATTQGFTAFDFSWTPVLSRMLRECDDTYQNVIETVNMKAFNTYQMQRPQTINMLTIGPFKMYYCPDEYESPISSTSEDTSDPVMPGVKDIPTDILDSQISNENIETIASEYVIKWEELSPVLGLTPAHEMEIRCSSSDYSTQKQQTLQKWKMSKGTEATYRSLINAAKCLLNLELLDRLKAMVEKQTDPFMGFDNHVKLPEAEIKSFMDEYPQSVIEYSCLQLKELLGKGEFGKVYSGKINDPSKKMMDVDVAVKMLRNIQSTNQMSAFIKESLVMQGLNHPHVLGLIGVCFDTQSGSPYIVLPFMSNGSLKTYLQGKRKHKNDINSFPEDLPFKELIRMCIEIAEGMKYLVKNNVVHGDLAARNCMVSNNLSVLVGDFGLARNLYSKGYYRSEKGRPCPLRWMPPETIMDNIYDEKTDVWSYGVTCWEVFSLGCMPYPTLNNGDIFIHVSNGGRLQKPTLCPEDLYEILSHCWQNSPDDRYNFTEILFRLKEYCYDNVV